MANLRTNNLCGEGGTNAYRGSVFFDGTGDKLSVPNSADIRLGSNDFTIEAWVKFGDVSDYWETIIGMYDTSADRRTFTLARYKNAGQNNDGDLYLSVSSDGTSSGETNAHGSNDSKIVLSINHWHHVAGVRDGNTLRVYINGIQVGTGSFSSSVYNNTTDALFIGDAESGDTRNMNGFISNLRLVNGTCLYPSGTTFTPPTEELTAVENTVLLCCQDSDDPTQEATGKTITAAGNLTDVDYVRMQPKVIPPYGVDAGNTFDGAISMNTPSYMYFPTGRTEERGRGRGVIFAGYSSPTGYTKDIYYLDIQSMGNAIIFGELTATRYASGAVASSTRGIVGGGRDPSGRINNIESVEIAIASNSIDFGDLTGVNAFNRGGGNQTRGIWMGGSNPSLVDTIEYVTIATKGNATDFGNMTAAINGPATGTSSTRMLAMGGSNPSSVATIDYIEIATTGNAQDFGDLTGARSAGTGVSSNTRAVAIGGVGSPALSNVIDFVTIATTGNATDFGDTVTPYEHTGSLSNSIRGVICGARTPSYLNIMESLTIATTGNSTDFGDIPRDNLAYVAGTSDSHGGLS